VPLRCLDEQRRAIVKLSSRGIALVLGVVGGRCAWSESWVTRER
jgi:hypothetical protein